MRIEIQDYTHPVSQAGHLLHELGSLVDAIDKADPQLLLSERLNGKPMAQVLLNEIIRLHGIALKIGRSIPDVSPCS